MGVKVLLSSHFIAMKNKHVLILAEKKYGEIFPQRGDHSRRRVAYLGEGEPDVSDPIGPTGKSSSKSYSGRDLPTSSPSKRNSREDERSDHLRTSDNFESQRLFLFDDDCPSPDEILALENEDLTAWELEGFT